jgi:glycosyltransferase involved in cell wall biosynthesis
MPNNLHPKISVIIPAFNAESYIAVSIKSVLDQTFTDFELVIINDGSKDATESVIKAFSDNRMRYFSKKNEGQCKALNFGLQQSKGDFIKFLDADDYINPEHLESLMKKIKLVESRDHKKYLYLCKWRRFSDNGNIWSMEDRPEWGDYDPETFMLKAMGTGPDMLPAWQWLIPKHVLELSGYWNEELTLGNDFEFSIRLILASKRIVFCEDAIVYYRSDLRANMSSDTSLKTILSVLHASRIGIENILSTYNSQEIRRVCADKLMAWLISYYPYIGRKLVNTVEADIYELGGSKLDVGWGSKMRLMRRLFGWKRTRMAQHIFYKVRYKISL